MFENADALFQTKTIDIPLKVKRGSTTFYSSNWTCPTSWATDVTLRTSSDDAKISNLDYFAANLVGGEIIGTDTDDWDKTDDTYFGKIDFSNTKSFIYFRSFTSGLPHTRGTRGSVIGASGDNWHWNGPTFYVYQKKNDNLAATRFVHKNATETAGYDIFYYNGVPIISDNESVRLYILELVFTDDEYDGDSGGSFALRSAAFTNSDTLDSVDLMCFSDEGQNTSWTDWTINSTSLTKNIYCLVPKDKQLWIKIKPNGDNKITVNTDKSTITYTELN